MAHPNVTKNVGGKIWHLEDSGLTLVEAKALVKHLRKVEEKRAKRVKTKSGYEVWWATK